MFPLQIVETEAGRFDLPDRSFDVTQMGRVELDRVICRRLEISHLPGAGMIDRRPVHRR
jgi:hypothetical protein